jgi:glycosyltransferase involved in cell wall biosynthesis
MLVKPMGYEKMNIFLPVFDLFLKEGGGETVYKQIIGTMKENTFYYLILDEPANTIRPPNVVAIPFNYYYARAPLQNASSSYLYECFLRAMNMARSLAKARPGLSFDIVDTPDYNQNGIFMAQALKHHRVPYGNIVLSLHGNVSRTINNNWEESGIDRRKMVAKLRTLENLQYQVVDHRYAISPRYARAWDKKYSGLSCAIIDPLTFVSRPTDFPLIEPAKKPNIYCISRKERLKGPDIFIDFLWFVPKDLYNQAIIVGSEDTTGHGSEHILAKTAKYRGVTFVNRPAQKHQDILALFRGKAINVVPSRYETLSLSALESLLQGCPTVISNRCGAVDYLKQYHPEIPFHEIDITCSREGAAALKHIIENYEEEREKLIKAVKSLPVIDKAAAIKAIYANEKSFKATTRHKLDQLFSVFLEANENGKKNFGFNVKQTIKKSASIRLRSLARKILGKSFNRLQKIKWYATNAKLSKGNLETTLKQVAKHFLKDPKPLAQWYFSLSANRIKNQTHYATAQTDLRNRIQSIENLAAKRIVDRVRLYAELSSLESQRDNPLIAAVYQSRILRWQQKDIHSSLLNTAEVFNQQGFASEAKALLEIHSPTSTFDSQLALLNKKLADNKQKTDLPLELLDDHRIKKNCKISVIVSLYKAAEKLLTFFKMLEQQTAVKQNDVEVVLIDSGSPTDEYSVFKQYTGELKDKIIYARSENRETIQAAWNRGIKLCTGKYVTFLAADEGIHPECLEILSKELDAAADVDWVMGSAIVAEIDKKGCLSHDIMFYDRSIGKQHSHILDCTYINYTPGLYRRSVHEQHGFYDETFSAAGDTEFKNRVSPFIKIKFISNILGAYNNYQEERTTAHPRAEIEDIRAWYLFRTPAGIAYLFQNKSEDDLIDLLQDTLGYQKSFCKHISTDIELGLSVATYLHKKTGKEKYKFIENEYRTLIDSCNNIELFDANAKPIKILLRETRAFKNTKKRIGEMLGMEKVAHVAMFHDNRYEQHWWPWSTNK